MVCEGKQFEKLAVEDWEQRATGRWEDVMPGAYEPKEFLKDHDLDGVHASVIYPSLGLVLFTRPNSRALSETFKAYNDWIAEFCSEDPRRLRGNGMILLDDVDEGVKEMERCAQMKLGGVMIPTYPEPHRPYSDPLYEPFWEAAEGLGMPLALHIECWRPQPIAGGLGAHCRRAPGDSGLHGP